MTFGEKCTNAVREYLTANNLNLSLGSINSKILAEIINKVYEHEKDLKESEKNKKKEESKELKLLFQSLCTACNVSHESLTRTEHLRIKKCLDEIMHATPDLTGSEIHNRATKYAKKYRGAALTPSALCSHWSEFTDVALPAFVTSKPVVDDVCKEPSFNWRVLAISKWPSDDYPHGYDFNAVEWNDLSLTWKQQIKAL